MTPWNPTCERCHRDACYGAGPPLIPHERWWCGDHKPPTYWTKGASNGCDVRQADLAAPTERLKQQRTAA